MKRKGKQRLWLRIMIGAPILTMAAALLCGWLMVSGKVGEDRMGLVVSMIAGGCAFLLSLYTSVRVPRKKLLWGMVTACSYGVALMLGNLLFFGEGYAELGGVLLPTLGAGAVASLLGTSVHRKIA